MREALLEQQISSSAVIEKHTVARQQYKLSTGQLVARALLILAHTQTQRTNNKLTNYSPISLINYQFFGHNMSTTDAKWPIKGSKMGVFA